MPRSWHFNAGNTCFLSTVLQTLYTTELEAYFKSPNTLTGDLTHNKGFYKLLVFCCRKVDKMMKLYLSTFTCFLPEWAAETEIEGFKIGYASSVV